MTDLSLELMDITFCDALPDLYCSWLQLLFFVGLSALSFVLSKWNACSVGLKSGNWLGHCRIFHLLPSKSPGLFLLYVLGHCPLVIWSAIQSTLLHLTESGQRVYISQYTSELIRLLLSSVTLSLNTSNPVPLEAMHMLIPSYWSTMFHRWCCVLCIVSCSKPFSSCHSGTGLS